MISLSAKINDMRKLIVAFLSIFLFSNLIFAQEFPEPMNPPQLVNDYANLLNQQEQQLLESKLRRYNDTTSSEFTIVVIRSTGPYDIGQYAAELGEKWGIGKKGKDNGLLLLVAVEDRTVWVATGYGLEPTITDANIKRVVESYIKPNFRSEQYFKGLDEATSIFMAMASGEFVADQHNDSGGKEALIMLVLFLTFMIGIPYLRYRAMKKHHYGGKKDLSFLTAMLLMGSMGRRGGSSFNDFSGGGGSFGRGGGGFGGFGGGSFGGGGAGGSW